MPSMRQITSLFSLMVALAFLPFVAILYALYVALVLILVAFPQFVYSRRTGRRVDWVERALPFGRVLKMSPAQMKKRKLSRRD